MQVMIDTLRAARSFEEAGFAKPQAEALASVIGDVVQASREDLVTKDFLAAQLGELRAEIAAGDNALRVDIAASKVDIIRWLLASQAALVIILVALANFTRTFG